MISISLRATALALLCASTALAQTVSLSAFIPRIDNLPSACNTVYYSAISGCVPGDFQPGATCSASCVRGLNQIGDSVKKRCADVDVGELSLIGVFQNGLGIASLCPGVTVTTIKSDSPTTSTQSSRSSTSTRASSSSSSSSTLETSSVSSTVEARPTPSSSSTDTQSEQTTSSISSTNGLVLDPNATGSTPTTTVAVPPEDTNAPDPSLAPGTQLSNAFSGGGSPFDVVATGSSSHQDIYGGAAAALLATAFLLIICA
ncbi:hypothetical protein COCVIDRAFT_84314 [Bipolaris victoriae FI3]|uniref:Extracellular membrane protein CFEM domain-containing protein n=2 Tax=Bipolaris TaxID=33194 RepID=W6Y539_COCC2|nr:uncharacterized protein COCCADRAFT_37061 [Bipolaris zeicola 26-R-13]XP_014562386.1 hypothetical protein COCVIDRAFT_84314 [Bipolaris victoriae FI3]EUC33123.1 hypothetical protein COCCADRAFT_37061 [Bipolaris zeicola 26-R-13]